MDWIKNFGIEFEIWFMIFVEGELCLRMKRFIISFIREIWSLCLHWYGSKRNVFALSEKRRTFSKESWVFLPLKMQISLEMFKTSVWPTLWIFLYSSCFRDSVTLAVKGLSLDCAFYMKRRAFYTGPSRRCYVVQETCSLSSFFLYAVLQPCFHPKLLATFPALSLLDFMIVHKVSEGKIQEAQRGEGGKKFRKHLSFELLFGSRLSRSSRSDPEDYVKVWPSCTWVGGEKVQERTNKTP